MKIIVYRFVDGHTEEIEVSEEVFEVFSEIEKEEMREEWRHRWRMRKKLVSMDELQEQGYQFEDKNSSFEEKLIAEEIRLSQKAALSKGYISLSTEQRQLLRQIYIEQKSLKAIAVELGITYQAVQNRHIKILNHLRKFFD